MSDYRIGNGLGLTYGDLALLDPQPRSDARVIAAQRDFSASGILHERNLHITLQYSALSGFDEVQTVLDQYGLESNTRNGVTLWAPDLLGVYRLYEGYAIRPSRIANSYMPRDIEVLVNALVLIG